MQPAGSFIRTGPLRTPMAMLTGMDKPAEMTSYEYRQLLAEDLTSRGSAALALPVAMAPGLATIGVGWKAWGTGMTAFGAGIRGAAGVAQGAAWRGAGGIFSGFGAAGIRGIPKMLPGFARGVLGSGVGLGATAATGGLAAIAYAGYQATESMISGMAEHTQAERYLRQTDWRTLPGISAGERRDLAREMVNIGTETKGGFGQVMKIAEAGGQAGLFNAVTSAEDYASNLKQLTKMSTRVSEILRSSLDDSIKVLGQLRQQGFNSPSQLLSAASGLRMYGAAAGMTPVEMLEFQDMGAQMARRAGLPTAAGAQNAAFTAAFVRSGVGAGVISPTAVAQAGGSAALTQGIVSFQNQVLQSGYGRAVMGASMTPGGRLDPQALNKIISGKVPLWGIAGQVGQRLTDPQAGVIYRANREEMAGELTPQQTFGIAVSGAVSAAGMLPQGMFRGPQGPLARASAIQTIMTRQFGIDRAVARPIAQLAAQPEGIEKLMERMNRSMVQERIRTEVGWQPMTKEFVAPVKEALTELKQVFQSTFKGIGIDIKEAFAQPFRDIAEYPMRKAGVGTWDIAPYAIPAMEAMPAGELKEMIRRTEPPVGTDPAYWKAKRSIAQKAHLVTEYREIMAKDTDLKGTREGLLRVLKGIPKGEEARIIYAKQASQEIFNLLVPDKKDQGTESSGALKDVIYNSVLTGNSRELAKIAPEIAQQWNRTKGLQFNVTLGGMLDDWEKSKTGFKDGKMATSSDMIDYATEQGMDKTIEDIDQMRKNFATVQHRLAKKESDYKTTVKLSYKVLALAPTPLGEKPTQYHYRAMMKAIKEGDIDVLRSLEGQFLRQDTEGAKKAAKFAHDTHGMLTGYNARKMFGDRMTEIEASGLWGIYQRSKDEKDQFKPKMKLNFEEWRKLYKAQSTTTSDQKQLLNELSMVPGTEGLVTQEMLETGEVSRREMGIIRRDFPRTVEGERQPIEISTGAVEGIGKWLAKPITYAPPSKPGEAMPVPGGALAIGGPVELEVAEINWKSSQILAHLSMKLGITN
jgi:hypothetical protein